jgi:hypothetical protein
MTGLDPRLRDAGLAVTVAQLVDLWADHTPAHHPIPAKCPGCGHPYSLAAPLCPTAAVVRRLLRSRRHEVSSTTFAKLTYNQTSDLFGKRLSTAIAPLIERSYATRLTRSRGGRP